MLFRDASTSNHKKSLLICIYKQPYEVKVFVDMYLKQSYKVFVDTYEQIYINNCVKSVKRCDQTKPKVSNDFLPLTLINKNVNARLLGGGQAGCPS